MISVAYICDEQYFLPTLISIRSLVKNHSNNDVVNVYVVCSNISEARRSIFNNVGNDAVNIHTLNAPKISSDISSYHEYVSDTALIKFYLPNILPDVNKIIYLDGDTLVLSDLSELFSTDVEEYYIGAVADIDAMLQLNREKHVNQEQYFNSGVMLMNLSKLREEKMVEQLEHDKHKDEDLTFMDQDTLNRVLGSKCRLLHPKYNYMLKNNSNYRIDELSEFYNVDEYEMKDLYDLDAIILHLTNRDKPWNSGRSLGSSLWFSYMEKNDVILLQELFGAEKERNLKKISRYQDMVKHYENEENGVRIPYKHELRIKECCEEIISSLDLNDGEKVYVYGAGSMAKSFYLALKGIYMTNAIKEFLVQDKTINLDTIFSIPVTSYLGAKKNGGKLVLAVEGIDSSLFNDDGWECVCNLNDYT